MVSHRPRLPTHSVMAGASSGSRYCGTSVAVVMTSAGPSSPDDISAATRRRKVLQQGRSTVG